MEQTHSSPASGSLFAGTIIITDDNQKPPQRHGRGGDTENQTQSAPAKDKRRPARQPRHRDRSAAQDANASGEQQQQPSTRKARAPRNRPTAATASRNGDTQKSEGKRAVAQANGTNDTQERVARLGGARLEIPAIRLGVMTLGEAPAPAAVQDANANGEQQPSTRKVRVPRNRPAPGTAPRNGGSHNLKAKGGAVAQVHEADDQGNEPLRQGTTRTDTIRLGADTLHALEVSEGGPQSNDPAPQAGGKKKRKPKPSRAERTEAQNAHYAVVLAAAEAAVGILQQHGIPSAVFGSLACRLYGASRCPKDVDLLVLQPESEVATDEPYSTAELKDLILRTNSRNFFLKLPRDPAAEYRILYYRTSYLGPVCKVDILTPGIMHLPFLPPSALHLIAGVPLVPFAVLLLHKLQGWDDHVRAPEAHKRQKQHQDAGDLKRLMQLEEMDGLRETKPWGDRAWFTEEFEGLTRRRVRSLCTAFPDRREAWGRLGFDTEPLEEEEEEKKEEVPGAGVRAEQDEDGDESEDMEDL